MEGQHLESDFASTAPKAAPTTLIGYSMVTASASLSFNPSQIFATMYRQHNTASSLSTLTKSDFKTAMFPSSRKRAPLH